MKTVFIGDCVLIVGNVELCGRLTIQVSEASALECAPCLSSRNIETCRRQYGGSAEQWERYHDGYLADAAARALRDAEDQARREDIRRESDRQAERNRLIEICERHYAKHFICGWFLLPFATLEGYAACALSEDWDQACIEDASRTRGKKIDACVSYYRLRSRQFFEALSEGSLELWRLAIGPRKVSA